MIKVLRMVCLFAAIAIPSGAFVHARAGNVTGTVTAIDQQSFTVRTTDGREVKVGFDSVTSFEGMGGPCSSKELSIGERVVVHVADARSGETPKAARVTIGTTTFVAAVDAGAATQHVTLAATGQGFTPDHQKVKLGVPVELVVTRTTDKTCAKAIKIPEYGIEKDLPLDKPVTITFVPKKGGEIRYTCGMGMMAGAIVVE